MSKYPEFAESLVLKLISRVRHATEQLRSVALKDVYGRVVTLLHELAIDEDGVLALDRSVTQQEIADRVGASREMVNQIFRDLVRGGYIEKGKERRMTLRVPSRSRARYRGERRRSTCAGRRRSRYAPPGSARLLAHPSLARPPAGTDTGSSGCRASSRGLRERSAERA